MAQAGFTPISLYYSATASAQPSSGNLVNGELALNIQDGKLFYKDATGAVQTLITRLAIGSAYQINAVNAGATAATYQGLSSLIDNSLTASTQGMLLYRGSSGWVPLAPGTNGQYLISGGASANPSWSTALSSGVSSFTAGTTGFTPSTASTGAVTLAGTLVSANGGTGFSTYAAGDLVYASGVNTLAKLTAGSSGTVLTIAGGVPSWGAQPVTSFATTLSGLTPQIASTGAITLAGTLNPVSGGTGFTTYTTGDIIYASNTNVLSKLAAGANGYVLTLASGLPTWAPSSVGVSSFNTTLAGLLPSIGTSGAVTLSGTLESTSGGTGFAAYATGDIIYASATNTLSKLAAGTNTYVLTLAAGVPTWAAPATGSVTSVAATSPVASSGGTTPTISLSAGYGDTLNPYASKTANYVLAAPNGSAGVPTFRAIAAADIPTLNQNTTGSAATLTTGRTISITGDLTYTSASFDGSANVTAVGTLATVNANVGSFTNASVTVNAKGLVTAVSSGSSGGGGTVTSVSASVPAFLSIAGSPVTTSGTLAITLSGTALPSANGGTSQTTYAAGDLLYASAANTLSKLTIGSNTTIMTSSGTAPQWSAASGVTVGIATNMAGGAAGTTFYNTAASTTTGLAIGSAYQIKAVNTGATAPSWQGLSSLIDNALSASTQGSIIYRNATSWVALAPGTNGQVLATAGASANPGWATVSVTGTVAPGSGGTGVANNAASTLTISGAFGTTLTVSAATSITLPTAGTLATLSGTETFANKTLSSPVISTIVNTGTLTLPTATDTLVGRATTDTLTNKTLTNPTVTNYTETPYSANSATAITLLLSNGTVQIITLTGNATITMPAAVSGKSFIMFLKQDATGSRTVTWSTVKWSGGTAPTITSTASRQDILSFFSDGTNWYGVNVGQNYTP